MLLPTIDDIDIKDKKVLIRLDFDFLFQRGFDFTDNHELNIVIPTIKKLIDENARIIIAANYSKLKNKKSAEYSMENFAAAFCEVLDCEVYLTEEKVGQVVNKISQDMVPGGILILNNFSGLADENSNNPDFARKLSEISDLYINEAFTLSHMELASTTSILNYFERGEFCFGSNFINEFNMMKSLHDDKHPFAIVINTDLIGEGIEIIDKLIDEIDKVFLIGEFSNIILNISKDTVKFDTPLYLKDKIECLIKSITVRKIDLLNAVDYFIEGENGNPKLVNKDLLKKDSKVLDIGSSTGNLFSESLSDVKKLVWFGPLPCKSESSFQGGSSIIFETIKDMNIFSLGLDKDPTGKYSELSMTQNFTYISQCYETYLEYIKKEELPVLSFIEGKFK
ncbi:MAG: phosphoglycerate kinase [Thermodesulfobacteriota bacterium]